MSSGVRKITIAQQRELLEHYLEHGAAASALKCAEYGVSPKYASGIAAAMGFARPRYRNVHSPRSLKDPRWERAKAVGGVVA